MAQLLIHAQPGQVITAEDWNLVVDAVNELLQAGQTAAIQIAAMLPIGTIEQPINVGTMVQITGQGFGFSIGQSKITFVAPLQGGTETVTVFRASMLEGSSDTRLLFLMPPIPNLPQIGAPVTMHVSNGVAEDHRSVYVAPVIITLTGDVFVNFRADINPNPNPNPVVQNAPAVFNYKLESGINMPAVFDLSADIVNATTAIPPGLISSIEFRDEGSNLISNKQVELGKNEVRNIIVRIPQIPVSFASQTFTLKVTASCGSVTNTDARTVTVGTPSVPPDPKIEVQQTGFVVLDVQSGNVDPNGGALSSSSIKLRAGKQGIVAFNVKLTQNGTYDVTFQARQGTTLNSWSPQLINTQATIQVPTNNDQTSRLMQIGLSPTAGASATGSVVFRIKRQGAAAEFSKEYDVQLGT